MSQYRYEGRERVREIKPGFVYTCHVDECAVSDMELNDGKIASAARSADLYHASERRVLKIDACKKNIPVEGTDETGVCYGESVGQSGIPVEVNIDIGSFSYDDTIVKYSVDNSREGTLKHESGKASYKGIIPMENWNRSEITLSVHSADMEHIFLSAFDGGESCKFSFIYIATFDDEKIRNAYQQIMDAYVDRNSTVLLRNVDDHFSSTNHPGVSSYYDLEKTSRRERFAMSATWTSCQNT